MAMIQLTHKGADSVLAREKDKHFVLFHLFIKFAGVERGVILSPIPGTHCFSSLYSVHKDCFVHDL
jgi:hypothetical protein